MRFPRNNHSMLPRAPPERQRQSATLRTPAGTPPVVRPAPDDHPGATSQGISRMRRRPALAAAALILVAGALALRAGAQPAPPAGDALRDAIVEANRELERRFRAGDMRAVAAMYTDDALLLGPGATRVAGRDAVDAYWTRIAEPVDWTLEVFEVRGGRGIAHQLGRSTLVVDAPDSDETRTSVVDFALVWTRAGDGDWRIAVDAYWPAQP
jgi:uncharacterized protein (TIGR02246 family)